MASNSHSQASVQNGSMRLNPALLLNPKGYSAPSLPARQNSVNSPFHDSNSSNASSTPANVEFQFSTPQDNHVANDQYALPNGQPALHSNNFGHMIDRMNNVEQRAFAPQIKRRKVEAEDSFDSVRGFGNGGSGDIGGYVKERQHEAAHQSPATRQVEAVDLTESADDNDLVLLQAPKDEEICYGMIQHARLNCHIVPRPKPGTVALMPNYWSQVKIMLRRKHGEASHTIRACDYTREIVGTVDPNTAAGLVPLLDSRLQLRTDCRIPTRQKIPGEEPGNQISKAYTLDLMLYGPRKNGKTVGRHLSLKNIWLRAPPRVEPGIKYENPQLVEGPKPPPAIKEQPKMMPAATPPQMMRSVEEIRSEVMGVFDSLTKSEELPEMEPDPRVQTELLKHQKQGLSFMMKKEKPRQFGDDGKIPDSFWQIRLGLNGQRTYYNVVTGHTQREAPPETLGGILADMMGLGKTLSILSLVATTLEDADQWSHLPPVQPQAPPPPKKKANSSGQFDVPTPQPLGLTNLKQNGKATLLICPLSTITNWEEQIKAHIKPNQLTFYVYHGSNRIKDPKKLASFDLVLTTYGSVSHEVASRNKGKVGPYPLEEIGWFRVVLDEAHMIREQTTLQFKAICRLQASRRWAVTGTPVQNKLDDLAALLAFLRLKPFDEKSKFTQYITAPFKVCDPEIVPKLRILVDSVTLRRLKDKIDLPPRTDEIVRLDFSPTELKLYQVFEKNAQDKVQVLAAGREKVIGGRVYIHILQSILRLRLISAHGRDLLSDEDLEAVQGMTQESAIDLDSDEDDEDNGRRAMSESKAYDAFQLMQETNSDLCISCQRKIGSNDGADIASESEDHILGYMTPCFHLLCPTCITVWKEEVGNNFTGTCPVCQAHVRFAYNEIRKSKAEVEHEGHNHSRKHEAKIRTKDAYSGYAGPHTKTRALLEDLLKAKADSEAQPDEPPFKSVVFSAWTAHLDLIQIALDNAGIRYTRLDGKMGRHARTASMDAFREDDSVHVILVSIMAGGLGLNLTAGNYVYVMEPQYNPAAEAQAVDRVHRLGQKRPVRTVRYIMRNSIEEKMLELQDKKKKLASLSMDRSRVMDKAEAAKQKLMDLRSLFK